MPWTEITRLIIGGRPSLRKRRDGCGVVVDRAVHACCELDRNMPRKTNVREVVNALFYIASTGCQWRQLPKEFPPYSTVQGYFYPW